MSYLNPKSTAQLAGHPLHPMLVPFPIAAFVGTLIVDVTFLNTANEFWFTAGIWLLRFGLAMAVLAALIGLIDFFGEPRIRSITAAWLHFLGNGLLVVLEAINLYIRVGRTDVSTGVYFSAVAVMLLLFNGWMGWSMVYKHRVAVTDTAP